VPVTFFCSYFGPFWHTISHFESAHQHQ
jgi:hypothetical protein